LADRDVGSPGQRLQAGVPVLPQLFVAAAVGGGRDLKVEYLKCFNPISGEELETASLPQDHYPIVVIEEEESSPIRGRQGLL
jgi:hypothetical protein